MFKIFKSKNKTKRKVKTDYSLIKTDKLGFNYDHYAKVVNARKEKGLSLSRDHLNRYEHQNRDGRYRIDGTKIKSKYHPLHDKLLVDNKGNEYHIDVVSEHFYYGKYLSISYRKVGTKSHGILFWENISSQDETIIESVKETKEKLKLKLKLITLK